jgi:Tol biopolymer transport system component
VSTREDLPGSYDAAFIELVQTHLQNVLASEYFSSSPRHQILLRTIVGETLAGRTEALKELVLAKEVFGRSNYDPRRHTLVRVEVNAVRRRLAEYYAKAGREDRIRISIPSGHYVAAFSVLSAKSAAHRWPRIWYAAAGVVVILVTSFVILLGRRGTPAGPAPIPVQITFDAGWTAQPAVSRDGSTLVYASDRGPGGNAEIWIQQAGRAPRQLTHDSSHDITPDISPDGKQVVFRSWQKEEGVWSISAEGGRERLLAEGGYLPRFSPDGKRVAFARSAKDEAGHIFIVPAVGGATEQVDYGTEEAHCPVWSPDGNEIAFVARDPKRGEYDFWLANATDSRALPRPLGVQSQLRALRLPTISSYNNCPQDWLNNRLLFITHQGDTNFLLQASLEQNGRLRRIRVVPASIGATGARFVSGRGGQLSILFAPERLQTQIWGYDLVGAGGLQQLTHDTSLRRGWNGTWPALSGDGNVLAFVSEREGHPDICLKDLRTGAEQLLAASPSAQSPLFLDRTGRRVLFVRKQGAVASVVLRSVVEKTDRVVATDCPVLQDWSSDGEFLLCADGSDLFQLCIGQSTRKLVLHLPRQPELARFSADARWVAFVSTTGQGETIAGYLAPLDGSNRTIEIDQEVYTLSLHWAGDDDAVYYWSLRDGFRCLYMQRLDPRSKVPQGDPVAVLHRHQLQHYPWSGGTLAVGSGRLAMTLSDELANIWKLAVLRSPMN